MLFACLCGLICCRCPLYQFLFQFVLLTLSLFISSHQYNPVHLMFFPTFRAPEHKFMFFVSLALSASRVSIRTFVLPGYMPRTPSTPCFGGTARALNALDNEERTASSNTGDSKTTRKEILEKRRVERQHQK